jgi:hypothetical protein
VQLPTAAVWPHTDAIAAPVTRTPAPLQIRSTDYAQSKVKQSSGKAIYRLVAMDLFSTDAKAYHVAKTFALPPAGVGV